jgi:phospholysine phosphohistidine inorganic pyrophosphate phosphatase
VTALLLDLDGVLYEGERALPGAADTVAWLAQQNIPHLFLTNTTSRPRSVLVEKLAGFDIHTTVDRILTPPVAATRWLTNRGVDSVALFVPEATQSEFKAWRLTSETPDAVVVGDLGEVWDFSTLNRAFRLLMSEPHPPLVALGMTRYWQAPDGLRLDTGPFVRALEYAAGVEAVVMGKPAGPFFHAALDILGATANETIMIGDDIRGDIDGAQGAGLRAVLVRTGKYRPADLELGVNPNDVIPSVAEVPTWYPGPANPRPE